VGAQGLREQRQRLRDAGDHQDVSRRGNNPAGAGQPAAQLLAQQRVAAGSP